MLRCDDNWIITIGVKHFLLNPNSLNYRKQQPEKIGVISCYFSGCITDEGVSALINEM